MRLTQFGTYVLPLFNKRDRFDTGDAGNAALSIVGGTAYDGLRDDDATEGQHTVSTSYEIIASTATAVQTGRDAVRALLGKKRLLWATMPDGTLRHAKARVARVRMERRIEYIYYQPVELTFDIDGIGWNGEAHGAPWYLDEGEHFDDGLSLDMLDQWMPTGSPLTATAVNGGNRAVSDVTLTVTAGTSTISNIRLVCGSVDWTWTGTVAVGKALIIDCGRKSVTNNNANAYNTFALNAGHTVADWLVLEPGNNTVTITYTGNATDNATFVLSYYDGWA